MNWTQTQAVVKATLDDLGRAGAKPLGERLLFRDRCFVGISFDFEEVSAIWLTAIQQLKFVDASGGLLKVVSLADDEPLVDGMPRVAAETQFGRKAA